MRQRCLFAVFSLSVKRPIMGPIASGEGLSGGCKAGLTLKEWYLLAAVPWSNGHGCSGGVRSVVVRQVQTCDSRAFFRAQR